MGTTTTWDIPNRGQRLIAEGASCILLDQKRSLEAESEAESEGLATFLERYVLPSQPTVYSKGIWIEGNILLGISYTQGGVGWGRVDIIFYSCIVAAG